jgi:hypothetical protein
MQEFHREDLIEFKKISKIEVWQILKEWYTDGMYSDILKDEFGSDLEEICNNNLERLIDKKNKKTQNK